MERLNIFQIINKKVRFHRVGGEKMQINISYTLYTDGDYSLRNAEELGCTNRDVVVDDFEYYDYVGSMEFKYEEEWRCKSEAKNFLWRFLCDGIHISYTHPWLLKEFYDIMESLENIINEYQEGISVAKRHITGNYEGTEIKIEISK